MGKSKFYLESENKSKRTIRLIFGVLFTTYSIICGCGFIAVVFGSLTSNMGPIPLNLFNTLIVLAIVSFYGGYLISYKPEPIPKRLKMLKVIAHLSYVFSLMFLLSASELPWLIVIFLFLFILAVSLFKRIKKGEKTFYQNIILMNLDEFTSFSSIKFIDTTPYLSVIEEFKKSHESTNQDITNIISLYDNTINDIKELDDTLNKATLSLIKYKHMVSNPNDKTYYELSDFITSNTLLALVNIFQDNGSKDICFVNVCENIISKLDKYDMSPDFRKNTYNAIWEKFEHLFSLVDFRDMTNEEMIMANYLINVNYMEQRELKGKSTSISLE